MSLGDKNSLVIMNPKAGKPDRRPPAADGQEKLSKQPAPTKYQKKNKFTNFTKNVNRRLPDQK